MVYENNGTEDVNEFDCLTGGAGHVQNGERPPME